jgi:hypothetical protein
LQASFCWGGHGAEARIFLAVLGGSLPSGRVEMLEKVGKSETTTGIRGGFDVAIASVATAVPAHVISQAHAAERAR